MAANDLLIVPPLIKYITGPLLGPSLLAGAARKAGHAVEVLDLNVRWIRKQLPELETEAKKLDSPFVGDHDRPSSVLRPLQQRFAEECSRFLPPRAHQVDGGDDRALHLQFDHEEVIDAADALARSEMGEWIRGHLGARKDAPGVVGLSLLYSGQVLPALATSRIARDLWPGTLIVWGGPHVTALRDQIVRDPRYGALVDRFVFGYAEQTYIDILTAVRDGAALPPEAVAPGGGQYAAAKDATAIPEFDDLHLYGWRRLTLPAQISRGCAYGRCTFCTYPAVEGAYRDLPLGASNAVVDQAVELGAAVSFKDSLLLPQRLEVVAETIGGRVPWSACTKLNLKYDQGFLKRIVAGGCSTLEFGLETLTPGGQLLIDKRQTIDLFVRTLDAAEAAGLAVVINYMTALPGADAEQDQLWLERVRDSLRTRPNLVAKVEHNTFELERLSPIGRSPESFGVRVTKTWPWATIMEWEPMPTTATERSGAVRSLPVV
jgi:hypothetical protein